MTLASVVVQTLDLDVLGLGFVLEQGILFPHSTVNTQEALAPSGNDRTIVEWDMNPIKSKNVEFSEFISSFSSVI